MHTFDYETAWAQEALPAFQTLSPEVHAAFSVVQHEAKDLQQDQKTLDMPWTPRIREALAQLNTEELARASRATYFAGHWHPGKMPRCAPADGSTWKFAHYADQLISERLGIPRESPQGTGTSWRVLEGALRVCFSTPDSWQWVELGYATEELYDRMKNDPARPKLPAEAVTRRSRDTWADAAHAWAEGVRYHGPLFDSEKYMVKKATA